MVKLLLLAKASFNSFGVEAFCFI